MILDEMGVLRRDRMIAAWKQMTSHTERLPGRDYGKCKSCGAMIEWIVTKSGKKMAQVPNMGEPHIVHCGKQFWTLDDWTNQMLETIQKEKEANRIQRITKGKKFKKEKHSMQCVPWEQCICKGAA